MQYVSLTKTLLRKIMFTKPQNASQGDSPLTILFTRLLTSASQMLLRDDKTHGTATRPLQPLSSDKLPRITW